MSDFAANATVVLVHGAWADGSCWQNVILPLRREGLAVMCAPIPLTSLSDDIAALEHLLEKTNGQWCSQGVLWRCGDSWPKG